MDSKPGFRNCKRSSTSFQLQSGILKRTKCQTYPLSHLDASCPKDLQAEILHTQHRKSKRQYSEFPSKNEDKVSQFIIKDLRIKRVYSPNLTDPTSSSVPSGEQVCNKEGVIVPNESSRSGDERVRKSFDGSAEVPNVDVNNSKFCLKNGYVGFGDEYQKLNGVSEAVDGKREEFAHSTPPNAEILARDYQGVSLDGCPRSSNGCVEDVSYANIESRMDSPSQTRSVLKPCFKWKLYKAPGSIAYKRLLPYLLSNDTCTLRDDPNAKHERNLEKRATVESNLCNCPRDSSSVCSHNCTKNAIFSSNVSLNAMKLSLPPTDRIISFVNPLVSRNTENFQNGNLCKNQKYIDSNNDLTLVTEGFGLKRNNEICAAFVEKRLIESGGLMKSQFEHLPDKEQSKTLELMKLDRGNPSLSEHLSSELEDSKLCVSKKWSNKFCENNKIKDDFNEESLRMTSLNSGISSKPVIEEKRDEEVGCCQGADKNLGGSTVSENYSDIVIAIDKKYDSYPRKKLIRNPLSQLKLLSSQGSINYRRMLPFLKDLLKDNSEYCALANIDHPNLEKDLATIHSQTPSSHFHKSVDKSESFSSCIKPFDGNSDTLTRTVLTATDETICETEHYLMPAGVNDELPAPSKLQKQQQHSELEMLDECKLEMDPRLHSAVLLNDQTVTSLYPTVNLESLTEEGSRLISIQSPISSEHCTRLTVNVSDAQHPETNSSQPNSSCVEAFVLPENPINVRKGILKRNPRGCRGICSCLNCSSFRLHAERAFEFSRNQLQDAEEVAIDLMKELSYLRDVLEKSADGANDDAEYHLYKVKEACRKASEAELIAKGRLAQMNYELNIHCRITCSQRPNVRFSGDIEKSD